MWQVGDWRMKLAHALYAGAEDALLDLSVTRKWHKLLFICQVPFYPFTSRVERLEAGQVASEREWLVPLV